MVDDLIGAALNMRGRYPVLSDYIRMHAQEMSEDVRKHIDLYVTEYLLDLGDGVVPPCKNRYQFTVK